VLQSGGGGMETIDRMVKAAVDFASHEGFEDDLCILGVDFGRRT